MSLADLKFEVSYHTKESDVIRDFLLHALKEAKNYDRAVGWFCSSALMSISVGIKQIVQRNGKIRVICSTKLSDEDIEVIRRGYEKRKVIQDALMRSFEEARDEFEEERYNILSYLIANGFLDIKIVNMISDRPNAMFHDKLGIIYDENNNFVAFNGSMNDSDNAFYGNSESVDVFTSIGSDYIRAAEKKKYFDRLWGEGFAGMEIMDFPDYLKERIDRYKKDTVDFDVDKKEFQKKYYSKKKIIPTVPNYIEIRDYQEKAFINWKKNDYRGIYDMATGTGKTYTALYSLVNLLNDTNQKLGIVICCPYQHLVNQWAEDLDAFNLVTSLAFQVHRRKIGKPN